MYLISVRISAPLHMKCSIKDRNDFVNRFSNKQNNLIWRIKFHADSVISLSQINFNTKLITI